MRKEYLQGKLLPPEVAWVKQLNVSRNTLRQAIDKLVSERLLVRKKGYDMRGARRSIFSGVKNWMSFSQEMKALGVKCGTALYRRFHPESGRRCRTAAP